MSRRTGLLASAFLFLIGNCYAQQTQTGVLNLVSPPLPAGTVGVSYPSAQYTGTGGYGGYMFSLSSGSLPTGLSLSSGGLLSGTPTTAGTFSYVVRLTDYYSEGGVLSPLQVITISPSLRIISSSLPAGLVGSVYPGASLNVAGGGPPYVWGVTAGALPPGLSLSSSGFISGTPTTAGLFGFAAGVRDSSQQMASAPFQIVVGQPIFVSPSVVPSGTVGIPYKPVQFSTNISESVLFGLSAGALAPGLTLTPGGVLAGTPMQAGIYTFTVLASGQSGSGFTVVTLLVAPATPFVLPPVSIPDLTASVPISFSLGQPSGGTPPYTVTLVGCSVPGVTLAAVGTLSGTPTTPGTYNCVLTATDASGASATAAAVIRVLPALTITTTSLPSGVFLSPYPATGLSAAGGKPPYTWSVASGTLPPGLVLSSAGNLSGTPSAAGTFPFVIKVTDASGASALASFAISIIGGPAIGPAQFPDGIVNTAYPTVTLSATGGTKPYVFTATGLPPGLSLGPEGTISGTPASQGTFSFTVQVTDANKLSATASYTLNIAAPRLQFTTTSLAPATAYTPYAQTVTASGGTGRYTFRIANGALPTGLTLDASGLISGTPTGPGRTFTVLVTDSGQPPQTSIWTFALAVDFPAVSNGSLQNLPDRLDAAQQQSFGFALQASYPTDIQGVLTLSFVSSAVVPSTDPALKFMNGDTKLGFTIPANRTDAVFDSLPLFSTGMVAGTITLAGSLTAGGGAPSSIPVRTIVVNPAAPVINSVSATSSGGQLTVVIQGFATTRQVTQAKFHFEPSDITVDVGAAFTQWYQSAPSVAFGSSFSYSQPFTIQGSLSGTVTVTLVNDRGTSNAKSAQF